MPAGNMTTTQKKRLLVIGVIVFRYLTSFLLGTLGMSSSTMFIIFRTINGLGWSIVGVVIPAIEATLLDKRAMGTTYAVYTALSAFAKGMVRSLGVSVYQSSGIVTATIAAGVFALAAILLVNFMNWNDEKLQRIKPKGKKGLFSGVNKNYMGVCFLMGCAVVTWTLNQQFNNVLAQERGIDITKETYVPIKGKMNNTQTIRIPHTPMIATIIVIKDFPIPRSAPLATSIIPQSP
jgi:MFS family permease